MRLPALLLLAACGGSAAPSTTTTTASHTTPSGEEDWRAYLAQIAGTPCAWIPGASFVACATDTATTLIGWEMNNRRYVAWRIAPDGKVDVLAGNASNAGWTFESPDGRIALTRTGPMAWTATGLSDGETAITVDPKATPPAAAPMPAANGEWRGALEGFTGTWQFSGTVHDAQTTAQVTCAWIAAATFVACKTSGREGVDLIGWEPQTARFVTWAIRPGTPVDVLAGTRDGKNWSFASATTRVSYGYESGIKRTFKVEVQHGGSWTIVADGSYETGIE